MCDFQNVGVRVKRLKKVVWDCILMFVAFLWGVSPPRCMRDRISISVLRCHHVNIWPNGKKSPGLMSSQRWALSVVWLSVNQTVGLLCGLAADCEICARRLVKRLSATLHNCLSMPGEVLVFLLPPVTNLSGYFGLWYFRMIKSGIPPPGMSLGVGWCLVFARADEL